MSIAVPSATSRRELNKVATRDAITSAALDFLRAKGLNGFTVDDVAAAAGVSRRTFFNYFSSVEAAIASFTERFLESVIAELVKRPDNEPILDSAVAALGAAGTTLDLAIMAETFTLTQDPSLSRFQLQAWDDCTHRISEVAAARLPEGTDDFYLHTLVGALIGSCRAAFVLWFERHGNDVSQTSLSNLHELLTGAVRLVQSGFDSPQLPTGNH